MEQLKPYEKVAAKKEENQSKDSFLNAKPAASSTPLRDVSVLAARVESTCYCASVDEVKDSKHVFCEKCHKYVFLMNVMN